MSKLDKLWAPWRIRYVSKKVSSGCIFCKILRGRSDKKNFIVKRNKHCFVVLNTFPYNNGHIMVVPNRHIGSFSDLSDNEVLEIHQTMDIMLKILKKRLRPSGFNIGMNLGHDAGAGIIDHIHTHLVPRWGGDTNFMPVIADTKVISQSLKELYGLLVSEIKEK